MIKATSELPETLPPPAYPTRTDEEFLSAAAHSPQLDEAKELPEPGEHLAHYRIEQRIGSGGMGVVYRTWDTALERPAALKLLHPSFSWQGRDVLTREAMALARLQHPNIASFFEAASTDAQRYLAMEYIDAQPLATRLRQGPLTQAELRRLASGLLWALAHAHSAGVLHRDLKPANIMLREGGDPVLLDFGIAQLLQRPGLQDDGQHTRLGEIAGSPGYMAPEQITGDTLSARSDLYAAALVLREALLGRPTFRAPSAPERARETLKATPESLVAGLPADWASVLAQALHPDPEQRPESAPDMLCALQRAWEIPCDEQTISEVLVLAAEGENLDPQIAWVGRALRNAICQRLSAMPGISLVDEARLAAVRADGGAGDALALARRSGAPGVIHGTLTGDAERLQVTLIISDARTGLAVDTRDFHAAMDELFTMQTEAVEWLGEHFQSSTLLTLPSAVPMAAAEACARAESAFFSGGKDGIAMAATYYTQALEQCPDTLAALAGLAGVQAMRYTFTTDPALLQEAESLARRALDLDPRCHAARTWLIYALMRVGRHDEGASEVEALPRSGADAAIGLYFGAACQAALGRIEAALALFQASLRCEPRRGWAWLGAGNCHRRLGDHAAALHCLRLAEEMEAHADSFPTAGCALYRAELLRQSGDLEGAWLASQQALRKLERSDFIYRDTFRALALRNLGRVALDRHNPDVAATAFTQAIAGVRGRPKALGAGHVLAQALAGLAEASGKRALLDEAQALATDKPGPYNFEWGWDCDDASTRAALQRAQATLA